MTPQRLNPAADLHNVLIQIPFLVGQARRNPLREDLLVAVAKRAVSFIGTLKARQRIVHVPSGGVVTQRG